jgi:hypothetical protein
VDLVDDAGKVELELFTAIAKAVGIPSMIRNVHVHVSPQSTHQS